MDFFEINKYREILKKSLKAQAHEWGGITWLAAQMNCQRSHLSRVLAGEKELSIEQALAAALAFAFTPTETDYFLLLVERDRAGTRNLQTHFDAKIALIKAQQQDLSLRLNQKRLPVSDAESFYYSAWQWSAIHILTSIPKFQTADAIAAKLLLPMDVVMDGLEQLLELELIKKQGQRYVFSSASVHLPRTSPFISIHHQNWRSRAIEDSKRRQSLGVHYTVVQSLSLADFEKLKSLFLKSIDDFQKIAGPSEPEELVAFHLDLYPA